MKLSVHHRTTYRYEGSVARSTQIIRLTPVSSATQKVESWQLDLPVPAVSMDDAFGNVTHLLSMTRVHEAMEMVATGTVEVPEVDEGEPAGQVNPRVFLRPTALTEPNEAMRGFVEPIRSLASARPLLGMNELMSAVQQQVVVDPVWYRGSSEPEAGSAQAESAEAESIEVESAGPEVHAADRVFDAGRGSWHGQVHVFLACCRLLGMPARHISGYVFAAGQASVRCRSWAEVWLGNRWVGFDIGLGKLAEGGRIRLSVGLDHLDACPVRGVRLGGGVELLSTVAQVRPAS